MTNLPYLFMARWMPIGFMAECYIAQNEADWLKSYGRRIRMQQATGTFEVKLVPQKADNAQAEAAGLGRMALDKQFDGALAATSQGEMLSILDREKGSGGYVAMERVTGTLDGRKGSFILQHNATMNRGEAEMNIVVVPDTGTGQLAGISGSMTVKIEGGQHYYYFDYSIGA
jgi:hypothetical protein